MPRTVYAFPSTETLAANLRDQLLRAQDEALAKHDRFTVALSGGSLPQTLAQGLLAHPESFQWDKWHIFYADERCVPLDHADSNHRLAREAFLDRVPIPTSQIHPINPDLVDQPAAAAEDYQHQLMRVFALKGAAVRFPVFDVILLGMGPDGHTCSLFPNHPLLDEDEKWVSYLTDSPKPPPTRITLTYPVVNHAHTVIFVATGASKQPVLERILDRNEPLPAGRVNPIHGHLYWYLDDAATATLTQTTIDRPSVI
ncbi:suppressor of los1-1 [Dimargaris cristalligena]|uniref:6-phosphogluconolactonase n=1 Tax=Dimargaris cristalligena TaxID=215637 RepID=A0A4Q0A5B2_9FUNG|nr:suppressor of los1-1 [Dimargaris cristalligena]RKP40430.1 6-phosphogluconolactonase [Dimargaris cristalligena]|eukprot:RKP40430.1 6-phosphogluconolactonase [Dimargaris cristalligena]